ncbi:MAG: TetR family transcriptional regulator [Actinomycetota bacterium]|nr:TetR family transcriptional regulator [Actinomycetota bacterium]
MSADSTAPATENDADNAAESATENDAERKSARTRAQIVDAALTLFREQGYQRTTMRAVATAAGVSVGNAYYYFASKEELVQGFYDVLVDEHARRCTEVFAAGTDFADRLRGVLLAWLEAAAPYHSFAGQFFATAAQPANPLSPFSPASTPTRKAAVAIYRELVTGSSTQVSGELAAELPELLWLYQLGVVLYWVHDSSPALARTRLLVEHTVPMVARLVRLSRLPLVRPLARQTVELVALLRGHQPGVPGTGGQQHEPGTHERGHPGQAVQRHQVEQQ